MPHTLQSALLRVLIAGEADAPDLIRKIRDWTEGRIDLDEETFARTVTAAETEGLVERHPGAPDKRTGAIAVTWALTPTGRTSAVEILADSLTRSPAAKSDHRQHGKERPPGQRS